jgi:fructokinase
MASILSLGEVLWDRFPDSERLGGAPANVAFHLAQAGHRARLASAVGEDELGRSALETLAEAGVETALVATLADWPTGAVEVELDAAGVPRFEILRDVAWDHIPLTPALQGAAQEVDVLVFGTLAQREAASRAAIAAALDAAPQALKVLDLNFRPPFVDREIVLGSLERADILKLSDGEADELPALLSMPRSDTFLASMALAFDLRRIYVTLGGEGCAVVDGETRHTEPVPAVTVIDTVGAGDAFTAAMIDGELRGLPAAAVARRANAAGAYVASQPGAMVPWSESLRSELKLG